MTLSIIIVSYNNRDLLKMCLQSLERAKPAMKKAKYSFEVIVSDNGSDDTGEMIAKEFPWVFYHKNANNLGFAKGNNVVRHLCKGEYILMLNPDTLVEENTLPESITYMKNHADVGAMTCKIVMSDGSLDKDARRSFPTPWVAFTHISMLDRLFPSSRLFARYWYGYLSPDEEAEVDVLEGAYCLVRRHVMDMIGWYDEDYFLNGEDIDLCWKIKEAGYKIMYLPSLTIRHYKGATKGKQQNAPVTIRVDRSVKRRVLIASSDAMKIFYNKRLRKRYPFFVTGIVLLGIWMVKQARLLRFELTGRI